MNETQLRWLRNAVVLALLAFAYWLSSYYVAALTGGLGGMWMSELQSALSIPNQAIPLLLSLFDGLGLALVSVPIAGILVKLVPQRPAAFALLVAIPAAFSILHDVNILMGMGMQLSHSTLALAGFDTFKTLVIPPLLTWPLRRWLPVRVLAP